MDMHDGLLNCFLTFEKFESETIIEAISRKVWIHGPKPFGAKTKKMRISEMTIASKILKILDQFGLVSPWIPNVRNIRTLVDRS